jgi:hypothetical protein
MSSADNIERSIAKLNLTTRSETDQHILDDAYAALIKGTHKEQPTGIWQIVIRSRFTVPAAIAAVILLAFALFVNMQTEKTIKVEGIYGAIRKAENIHISEFQAGRTNPDRQVWASENLGVKLFKTEIGNDAQYTLWDTNKRVKMIKFLSSNSVQTEPITQQMLDELGKTIVESADLVPFSDRKDIPKDAQWNRIDDRALSAAVPGTKAYELTWLTKGTIPGVGVYKKWRVYTQKRTDLPKRIEWYSKARPEDEYRFEKFAVIAYPSEDEIASIIRNVFGRKDNPEFIGTPEAHR